MSPTYRSSVNYCHVITVLLMITLILLHDQVKSDGDTSSGENRENFASPNFLQRLFESSKDATEKNGNAILARSKRNLLQLGRSVMQNTRYSLVKLSNYGNW